MAWGIEFTAEIYLSRQDYGESIDSVQGAIDDLEKCNRDIKERMLMMVMGGTSSVCVKDVAGEELDAVDVLHTKFTELMQEFDENFSRIIDLQYYKAYLNSCKEQKGDEPKTDPFTDEVLMGMDIEGLKTSAQALNAMRFAGINTIGQLIQWTPKQVKGLRNIGNKALTATRNSLAKMGLHLRGDDWWLIEYKKFGGK